MQFAKMSPHDRDKAATALKEDFANRLHFIDEAIASKDDSSPAFREQSDDRQQSDYESLSGSAELMPCQAELITAHARSHVSVLLIGLTCADLFHSNLPAIS